MLLHLPLVKLLHFFLHLKFFEFFLLVYIRLFFSYVFQNLFLPLKVDLTFREVLARLAEIVNVDRVKSLPRMLLSC